MTDLSPPEHEHTAAIDEAAQWLSQEPRERIARPIVPLLRERFGLTALEAVAAIKTADELRRSAA